MKKIYVLRHAKAGKANKKILDDHDRPLTKKGIEACKLIRQYFTDNRIKPDVVICSTAKRTKSTAELTLNFDEGVNVLYTPKLYLAGVADIFSLVKKNDDSNDSVILVGHNPGLQEFCLLLVKEGSREMIRKIKDFFPPGAFASFDIDIEKWSELSKRSGVLTDFVAPKNLD